MTTQTALSLPSPHKRIRASEHAVSAVLKALAENGLSVDKLCIEGGKVEIHVAGIEEGAPQETHTGLEKW